MIEISQQVRDAQASGVAVVALESTILTHGLPAPENLQIAHDLERGVTESGAVPATVAIVDGKIRLGLSPSELERVCSDDSFHKAGVADLSLYVAQRASAGTTVSATAFVAAKCGIRMFATGGIGGVHRGDTGDESSDLYALSRLPIAVVSAGAKTVLNLPRTLERLESLAVPVVGYRCAAFPAFYCRDSGLPLEHRVDDVAELAAALRVRFDGLGQAGMLIVNAVPEEAALPLHKVEGAITSALAAAAAQGVTGKAVTPFLLERLASRLGPEAIVANRALAVANARLAGEIAVALHRQ